MILWPPTLKLFNFVPVSSDFQALAVALTHFGSGLVLIKYSLTLRLFLKTIFPSLFIRQSVLSALGHYPKSQRMEATLLYADKHEQNMKEKTLVVLVPQKYH